MGEFNQYPANRQRPYIEVPNFEKRTIDMALNEARRPLSRMEKRVKRKVERAGLTWARGETIGFIGRKKEEVEKE